MSYFLLPLTLVLSVALYIFYNLYTGYRDAWNYYTTGHGPHALWWPNEDWS